MLDNFRQFLSSAFRSHKNRMTRVCLVKNLLSLLKSIFDFVFNNWYYIIHVSSSLAGAIDEFMHMRNQNYWHHKEKIKFIKFRMEEIDTNTFFRKLNPFKYLFSSCLFNALFTLGMTHVANFSTKIMFDINLECLFSQKLTPSRLHLYFLLGRMFGI